MPDINTVHYDVPLTNISIAYRNTAFVAPMISPEIAVRKQSDRYFVYDTERAGFRSTFDGRAPGTEATEVDFQLSADSYFCDDHALESVIPDEERDNVDSPLQPAIDRTEFLVDKILLNQEIDLAGKLLDLSTIPGVDLDSGTKHWNNSSNDPMATLEEGRQAILDACQQLPNTLVLSYASYRALRENSKVSDRVKYSSQGVVGTGTLAELFDVERVLVARSVKNTAGPGAAPSMVPVWGQDAALLYVPSRPSLKSIAPMLSFVWAGASGASRGYSVQTWREERRKAMMLRVQKYYDQKVVAPGAAYVFKNTITE